MTDRARRHRAPFLTRLVRNRVVLAGLVIAAVLVFLALFAGAVAPRDPQAINIGAALHPPNAAEPFGTDRFGRDLLSRVIHGSTVSLGVAFASVGMAMVAGTILGLISGYFGGVWDMVISRLMDILFSFPMLLLAIALAAMMGPGTTNVIRAIAIVNTPFFARVVRASVLAEREREYVDAARLIGASSPRIILLHVLPNVLSPLIVQVSVTIAYAILTEASLSYLGLGTELLTPSWGGILNDGRTYLQLAPWISIFPGLTIMLAVLAFNLLGDGLRDSLDPRMA